MTVRSTNIATVEHRVDKETRWRINGHRGGVLWFTGLSGAGKTTLALELEQALFFKGWQAYVLDGDNIRQGLSSDLAFAPKDRAENIRRIGEVAALFADAGFIMLTAFISPYRADRQQARRAAKDAFHEVYLAADVETCEKRDPKGLYEKARRGEIPDFTGISAPYEVPENAELMIDTATLNVRQSLDTLLDYVERNFATHEEPARITG